MCVVLPGASPTRAKFFRSRSLLMTEDLPTFDLPANTICGRPSCGQSATDVHRADELRVMQVHAVPSSLPDAGLAAVFGVRAECGHCGRSRNRRSPERNAAAEITLSTWSGRDELQRAAARSGRSPPDPFRSPRGMMTVLTPWRSAAIVFSFRPPIGRTRPRMRDLTRHGDIARAPGVSVSAETIAVQIVMPADGPSFGTAPSGKWTWISFVLIKIRVDAQLPVHGVRMIAHGRHGTTPSSRRRDCRSAPACRVPSTTLTSTSSVSPPTAVHARPRDKADLIGRGQLAPAGSGGRRENCSRFAAGDAKCAWALVRARSAWRTCGRRAASCRSSTAHAGFARVAAR